MNVGLMHACVRVSTLPWTMCVETGGELDIRLCLVCTGQLWQHLEGQWLESSSRCHMYACHSVDSLLLFRGLAAGLTYHALLVLYVFLSFGLVSCTPPGAFPLAAAFCGCLVWAGRQP